MLSGECFKRYFKWTLLSSKLYQVMLHLFCFIFGTVPCIQFCLVGFLGILNHFFFFLAEKGECFDSVTKTFLMILALNHTHFLLESILLGTLWLLTLI